MEPGHVVEYIDSQKIICAVVLEVKNLRLRLLTEGNREVKLSAGRLTHHGRRTLDPGSGRDRMVMALKEISARRRALSSQIDVKTLWEVLNAEQEWIDLPTMAALCFPDHADGDSESAVVRAFFNDRLYFKFNANRFLPHAPEKVNQIMAQRESEARQSRIIEQGGLWLLKVLDGGNPAPPQESAAICEILSSYHLWDKESPHRDEARQILQKAGTGSASAIFTFMVRIGAWQPHENLDLLRYQVSAAFPQAVHAHATALAHDGLVPATLEGRSDLRRLALLTIDGPATQDFDDALSLEIQADHCRVGIHIADVAHVIARESLCDAEALNRGSSIYMPDQKIPMLPPDLSEGRDRTGRPSAPWCR
jgi:exoribonuclease-2